MRYSNKKIVIIGAGPAALSLAASLELAKLHYTVLEKNAFVGGQLPLIHNELDDFVAGTYANGIDFAKKFIGFYEKYNLNIEFESAVTSIDMSLKTIDYIQNGLKKTLLYDILVVATGSRCKKAEKSLTKGLEKTVYYRISNNLDDFVDKSVAVVGSGDNATIAALKLAEIGKKVLLINRNDRLISRPDLISDVYNHPKIAILNSCELKKINKNSTFLSIECANKKTEAKLFLGIDAIVFKIGYLPNTEIVSDELELDDRGYIKTSNKYKTSIEGVFAIGDVVSGAYKRISIVMGHGTDLGNYFLKEYLIEEE